MLALDIMGDCVHPRFVVGSVLLIVFFFICCVFVFVASSSELSIFDCHFGFL
jgi:hypothetical protein